MTKISHNSVKSVKNIASKMPKTLTEAINFEGEDVDFGNEIPQGENEAPVQSEPAPKQEPSSTPTPNTNEDMDVMAFVDDIRKKALRGMAQLADNPDDSRYQLLKRIWQICDKKPEQETQPVQPQPPVNKQM